MPDSSDRRQLKWIGLCLYTIPDAHQMTHVPATTIRRWIKGYRYRRADGFAEAPSVWQGDLLILEQARLVESDGFLVPPKYGAKGRFTSVPP